MAEIKSLLDEVIAEEIQNLDQLPTDEKSQAIKNLAELHKLRIAEMNFQAESDSKDKEALAAKQQARSDRIDRCMRTGVSVAELVLPLIFYGVWMGQGFRFEETGSFTSTTFKNLLNRFRPTK